VAPATATRVRRAAGTAVDCEALLLRVLSGAAMAILSVVTRKNIYTFACIISQGFDVS
jgi:hypothetical protein